VREIRQYLRPAGLGEPDEPYSHAVLCDRTLYIAGQVALDEHNEIVGMGDAARQAEQVWANIRLAVEAAGGGIEDIVKITIFLSDIRNAPAEIAVRRRLFEEGQYPICTQVQVANLATPDLLMEIDAIAVISS
jgi:enamine deaminase RidA (YjgF/YER057c/UK114 family)